MATLLTDLYPNERSGVRCNSEVISSSVFAWAAAKDEIGGFLGHSIETIDDCTEEAFWKKHYQTRPYVKREDRYEAFAPSYRFGWESCQRFGAMGLSFEASERTLQRQWHEAADAVGFSWERARGPVKDAWERIASRWGA